MPARLLLAAFLLLAGCRTADHWYRRGHHSERPALKVRYFGRALELEPRHARALRERGAAYIELGQPQEAIADLSRAIELDPRDAASLSRRGMAYLTLGRQQEAQADLQRAGKLAPQAPDVLFRMARLQDEQGNDQAALAGYDRVVAQGGGHVAARRFRARLLFKQGKLDAARRDYRVVLEQGDPFLQAEAYVELVLLWLAEDKPELAQQTLEQAMRRLPGLPVLEYQAGGLAYVAERFSEAYRHFGLALTHRYHKAYCFLFAALSTERVHKIPHARPLQKILANEKLAGWPLPLLEAYAGKRTPESAWQAASDPAQQSEAGYFLGELALLEGQTEEARRWFARAVATKSYRTLEKYLARLRLAR